MKHHALLLTQAMALARAERRKTQTRRGIGAYNSLVDGRGISAKNWDKYQFDFTKAWVDDGPSPAGNHGPYLHVPSLNPEYDGATHRIYPRIQPGDGIWWRETHYVESAGHADGSTRFILYRAADPNVPVSRWTPGIHMPRWASRFQDEVSRVRIERLQYITHEDAIAEGVERHEGSGMYCVRVDAEHVMAIGTTAIESYRRLFESINGPGAWAANPFVYVYDWPQPQP